VTDQASGPPIARFHVLVEVRQRPGIADPQGATIERALPTLGYGEIHDVRVGKAIRFTIDAPDADAARARVEALCQEFLTNPVIEDAVVTVEEASA
jgi:phosphoribosylformylglycinamidine synthase PurS subunit